LNGGAVSGVGGRWLVQRSIFEANEGEGGGLAGDGGHWTIEEVLRRAAGFLLSVNLS
jgi:hypothetical protein